MNIEDFRDYCLSKAGVSESFPFDASVLVFKVGGKMFALTNVDKDFVFTVKCDPEESIALREQHPSIAPAWHMNKKYWIQVAPDGHIGDQTMKSLIDRSYELVRDSLPKKLRESIK